MFRYTHSSGGLVSFGFCAERMNVCFCFRGGRCGKERPAEVGCGGRNAAAAREEASSLHHERLKFSESLERNSRTAVVPEYIGFSALVP
jgi:hypothetical protein